MKNVYLDNAATTPADQRVIETMMPYFSDNYGNPSSMHGVGVKAKEDLRRFRKELAGLINADEDEIIFTSGGTESNNLAIKGVAYAHREKGNHIIVSAIEHDCILNACRWLEANGFIITYLPVDGDGIVDLQILERAINPKTVLVSVMHVNNEIGTIEPIEEIGRICKRNGALFHTDACQSFGKIPVDVSKTGVSLMSLNAHKIYGPKGIGCLYVKKGIEITPLLHGGGQEFGLRSTTENLPGIAGFVKAAKICHEEMEQERINIGLLASRVIEGLQSLFPTFYLNGSASNRLYTNVNFGIGGMEGEAMRLLLLLDDNGIAVSAGSACSNNDESKGASHVLQAIGRNQFEARGAVRISLGRFNTIEDVGYFLKIMSEKYTSLKPIFS